MFDTHCHLQDERICESVDDVVAAADSSGVRRMLCCGCREADWSGVARINERYGAVACAFGVHPWYVDDLGDGWESRLEKILMKYPASAVGEIGLDNSAGTRNDIRQAEVFVRQLEIARRYGRPVSIHCRKGFGTLIRILKDMGGLEHGGAVHSYSGPPDLVGELEKLGCYISFSGAITYPRNRRAAESLKRVSLDRLLIETDSPDLPPAGTAAPNVPANLHMIRDRVSEILALPASEVSALSYDNGMRLFY